MQLQNLTIVGVGLIGGSIGLAAKQRGLVRRVRGLGRRQASLAAALNIGAIDEAHLEPAPALADADLVVFCTPVDQIADQVLQFAPLCPASALLTDAGSTKGTIVERVEKDLPQDGPRFVGSHPLAGSEKRGPEFADADLFQGRWTILTPTQATDGAALERIAQFWSSLGSRVKVLSPEAHDRALAMTSHLPHLVAAALAGALPPEWYDLTATGFRDTTRIAAGDPGLWAAIFHENRGRVLEALDHLETRLDEYRHALSHSDDDETLRLLTQAKEVRDALGA